MDAASSSDLAGAAEIADSVLVLLEQTKPDPVLAIAGLLGLVASFHVMLGGDQEKVTHLHAALDAMIRNVEARKAMLVGRIN